MENGLIFSLLIEDISVSKNLLKYLSFLEICQNMVTSLDATKISISLYFLPKCVECKWLDLNVYVIEKMISPTLPWYIKNIVNIKGGLIWMILWYELTWSKRKCNRYITYLALIYKEYRYTSMIIVYNLTD